MKNNIGRPSNHPIGKMVIFLAAISLMPPASASILCIAPDFHAEIEELNGWCCAFSEVSEHSDSETGEELSAASSCRDCTDYLISPTEYGPFPKPHILMAGALADACSDLCLWTFPHSSLFLEGAPNDAAASSPPSFASPLRC